MIHNEGLGSQDQRSPQIRPKTNGRACVNCHQRKVRCDALEQGIPCSNCIKSNRTGCRMYERKSKHFSTSRTGSLPILLPRASETASLEDIVKGDMSISEGRSATYDTPPTALEPDHLLSGTFSSELESVASQSVDFDTDRASKNLADVVNGSHLEFGEFGRNELSRLHFIGNETSNLNFMVQQRSHEFNQDSIHHIPSRQLPRNQTAHNSDGIPLDAFTLPDKFLVDELIHAYFTHINCGWPIVDEEDFMTKYKNRDPRNPPALTLLHAILLVGAHVLSRHRSDVAELKSTFFSRAKALFDARFEQDRTIHVQVALLMTWHSDGVEDILANSWQWVGHAARVALGLGMHRNSDTSSLLPVYKRAWVRLWWVLVQFDVLVSVAYGRPQALNIEGSNVPSLTDAHFIGIPNARKDFVIQHSRLCVIMARILTQKGSLRSSMDVDLHTIRQVDDTLADFNMRLPDHMRLSLANVDVWQSTLHLTYNNFLILVHRAPQIGTFNPVSPEVVNDLEICRDASMTMTLIFESLRAQGLLSCLWLSSVNSLFTAILQVSIELNSSNPVVACRSSRRFESLLHCLRDLSREWLYALSVLRLFEDQSATSNPRMSQA
ncbi:fungal-specific transcription factor domain-containing protein [Thelonectria olida]|uniref:Fungal-specific transcription factor domain-containing protein n=1 Tax=Thelonectria olida TaxID=1576542 RepID=A0A9P8W105_9HYPO|nr:fungal-specific transcription factor domain-containing protein [Thelonectria olida]